MRKKSRKKHTVTGEKGALMAQALDRHFFFDGYKKKFC